MTEALTTRRVNVRADYDEFLLAKATPGVRFEGDYAVYPTWEDTRDDIAESVAVTAPHLHEYQRFATTFAVARARSAIFAECGLGKTSIALAWLRSIENGLPAVVAAPLAAQHEFIAERDKFFPGMDLAIVPTGEFDAWLDAPSGVALVTHHAFIEPRDLSRVASLVLDESSILKSGDGRIAQNLCRAVRPVPWRLALSATPAPNDPVEFATHATFLGYVRSDAEFRVRFFIHDGKNWRLKRHAKHEMPRWMSRFAIWMIDPAAYGMPCPAALPQPYQMHRVRLDLPVAAAELVPRNLFGEADGIMTMSVRSAIRKAVYEDADRTARIVELAQGHPTIVWCIRNFHADELEKAIRSAGIRVAQIAGTTDDEERIRIVRAYQRGDLDCIVSKAAVIGHGVNLQRTERMIFAGYNESYEAMHQAIRRGHRQGREGAMDVYMLVTPDEESTVRALDEKGDQWRRDADTHQSEFVTALRSDLSAYREGRTMTMTTETSEHLPAEETPHYTLIHGDCIEVMEGMDENSIDLSVFSPPFASLYTYSSEIADMGNCSEHGDAEFNIHFAHFAERLLRILKPGRIVAMHLAQLVAFRTHHGRKGLRDFRGRVISTMEDVGWYYFGEFVIPKNPQAQAIRTKSDRLQFSQLRRNSLESTPSLNDYVLEFRKPGDPEVRVLPDVSNDEWIEWASGVWSDIRETDVLGGWQSARGDNDEKHICPLQLPVIDRVVRLWSNPDELVFSPFAGIGSELYMAIKRGRRAFGIELKPEYFRQAVVNADKAVAETHEQLSLNYGD